MVLKNNTSDTRVFIFVQISVLNIGFQSACFLIIDVAIGPEKAMSVDP